MRYHKTNRSLAKWAALAWIVLVVAAYHVVHKPFDAGNVVATGQALAGLGGAGVVAALGSGAGLLLLQGVDLSPLERLVWATALGLGLLSLAGLILGATGLLRPWLLWTLTVVALAATAGKLWPALKGAWSDHSCRPHGLFQTILAAYCAVVLFAGLVWALTPPAAWDGLVYHLTAPRLYLKAGRLVHSMDLPYLGFPQLTEMLFTWGIGMVGERAAAPIHWLFGLLSVLALVSAGRRWFGGGCGWLGAAVLLSARTILTLLGWPYVDLALLLYATLAFLALVHWAEDSDGRWLVLSGAVAGLGLSTKYTALALLPAIGTVLLFLPLQNGGSVIRNLRSAIRNTSLSGIVALLVWAPWLAKNAWFTGNPVYPFFFRGIHWDSWRSWWFDRAGTGLAHTAPYRLLTAPWDATIWGLEGRGGYSATVGPLYLALLPLLFLVWRRLRPRHQRWLAAAIAYCAVLYAFWLWGLARTDLLRQTRLLFPAFGVLALLVGAAIQGLENLPREAPDIGWLVRVIVAIVLILTLTGTSFLTARGQPVRVLLGLESRDDFLARRLGWYYRAVGHINGALPTDSVVLFLWEPRSYHCTLDCRPDALLDRWPHATHVHGHHSQDIARAWRSAGVTHVLLHQAGLDYTLEAGFDPVTPADLHTLDDLTSEHMSLAETFGSAYHLYRFDGD